MNERIAFAAVNSGWAGNECVLEREWQGLQLWWRRLKTVRPVIETDFSGARGSDRLGIPATASFDSGVGPSLKAKQYLAAVKRAECSCDLFDIGFSVCGFYCLGDR